MNIDRYCAVNQFHKIKISACQKLSEQFIEKHQEKLNWNYISGFQILTESFIEKYRNKVNWENISGFQILTEFFIKKYQKNIQIPYLLQNKKILIHQQIVFEKY